MSELYIEYNENGDIIYRKNNHNGLEEWFDYDENNELKYYGNTSGFECLKVYTQREGERYYVTY